MHAGHSTRGRAAFWALVALAGATRLVVALADYRSLITTDVYPDDAFYYLRIAQNVVAGHGWTFDGISPTNGFHPLYMLMILPIVALSGSDLVLPIHLTAVLLTGWAVATAVVLHALVRRVADGRAALFALLLWAICPYFIIMSVNGLETGLGVFFVLLLPILYVSGTDRVEPPGAARALALGGACGLAVLARLDLVLLVAALLAHWLLQRQGRSGRRLTTALIAAVGAGAVWLPWGLISHAATGHWLPTSGAASREIALNLGWRNMETIWPTLSASDHLFDPAHVPASFYADVATKLGFVFVFENPLLAPLRANVGGGAWAVIEQYLPYRLFCGAPAVATGLMALGLSALALRWRRRRARAAEPVAAADSSRAKLGAVLGVYLALVAVGYVFYSPAHWYFNRYLVGPILLTTTFALAPIGRFFARPDRRGAGLVAALVIVACQLGQWRGFATLRWSEAPATGFLASWRAIGAHVDPQARLGSFQTGIYGYFGQREVINLDGKVNQDALEALRGKRIHQYIRAQHVRYILDSDLFVYALCARHAPPGTFSYRPVAIGARTGGVQLFEVVEPAGPETPR